MTVLNREFNKKFFIKIDGKILKSISIKNGEKYKNVRVVVNAEDNKKMDIAILPADLMAPGLICVVRPTDVIELELFDTSKEMIDVLMTFNLRPPSQVLERLIDDLSSIKRKKMFDKKLSKHMGKKIVEQLSAVLWLIDDPNVEKRFALPTDVE